jgi:hypothetical protein
MDDMTKKLLGKCDSQFPGERVNALDLLYDHLQKGGQTFAGLVHEFEHAIPLQQYADLEQRYNTAAQDNAAWVQRGQQQDQEITQLRRAVAALKAAVWLRLNWKQVAFIAAVPVVAWIAYVRLTAPTWPDGADIGLRAAVGSVPAAQFGRPFVTRLQGKPYWLLIRGEVDSTSFANDQGHLVAMRCLHVFGAPEEQDSGQFLKPQPYSLFGFGWMSWPERLVQCSPVPEQGEAVR